jgi:hypothetical protein
MNAKALTITVSMLVGIAALIVAVMAVGSVPLGADTVHLTQAQYAQRTAAADQLDARIQALASDVPPDLPAVPARLSQDGTTEVSAAQPPVSGASSMPIPTPQAPYADDDDHDEDHYGDHDDDHEEREAEHGEADD